MRQRLSPVRRWSEASGPVVAFARRRVFRILRALGCAGVIALASPASPALAGDADRAVVGDVVKGIIGYTRWSVAPNPLRFCFVGEVSRALEIEQAVTTLASPGSIVFSRRAVEDASLAGCDVAYVVALGLLAGSREALALSAPGVLTIGEGEAMCSLGTTFCLMEDAGEAGFATNLDAIARSGLKVNPRVLKLSQQLRSGRP